MMDRRVFLKVTGLVAIAGAAVPLSRAAGPRAQMAASAPSDTRLAIREPGFYRVSGRVRLDAPQVEISGITHTQRISWSGQKGSERPVASFTTFEHFDGTEMARTIRVRGGHLEGVTAVPVHFT